MNDEVFLFLITFLYMAKDIHKLQCFFQCFALQEIMLYNTNVKTNYENIVTRKGRYKRIYEIYSKRKYMKISI